MKTHLNSVAIAMMCASFGLLCAPSSNAADNADLLQHFDRPSSPRIHPVDPAAATEAERSAVNALTPEAAKTSPVMLTCLRNRVLCETWRPFSTYITSTRSGLTNREIQLLVLRTAFLCRSNYVWNEHVGRLKEMKDLAADDVRRIPKGPDAPGWTPVEAALLRAADELHKDQLVSDSTWKALASHFNNSQLLDVVFTVGEYTLSSMYTNSAAVQLSPNASASDKK